jgi:hypothetical protein
LLLVDPLTVLTLVPLLLFPLIALLVMILSLLLLLLLVAWMMMLVEEVALPLILLTRCYRRQHRGRMRQSRHHHDLVPLRHCRDHSGCRLQRRRRRRVATTNPAYRPPGLVAAAGRMPSSLMLQWSSMLRLKPSLGYRSLRLLVLVLVLFPFLFPFLLPLDPLHLLPKA